MMDLVVDANILFAALIKESITKRIILRNDLKLYAPEYLFEEFEKYKGLIKQKTKRSDKEFNQLLRILKTRIIIIPQKNFKSSINKAKQVSPDPKDILYFALALKYNISIWSNDKDLKEKQDVVIIYTTKELM